MFFGISWFSCEFYLTQLSCVIWIYIVFRFSYLLTFRRIPVTSDILLCGTIGVIIMLNLRRHRDQTHICKPIQLKDIVLCVCSMSYADSYLIVWLVLVFSFHKSLLNLNFARLNLLDTLESWPFLADIRMCDTGHRPHLYTLKLTWTDYVFNVLASLCDFYYEFRIRFYYNSNLLFLCF